MFLSHGEDDNGQLINIDEVSSGKTALKCPFCHAPLLAKKGRIKEHHFAHVGETCAESINTVKQSAIPYYDIPNGLTGTEQKVLGKVAKYRNCRETWFSNTQRPILNALIAGGLVKVDSGAVSLTRFGNQVLYPPHCSSGNFHKQVALQEAVISAKLTMLKHTDSLEDTSYASFFLRRLNAIFAQNLYVLRVNIEHDGIGYPLYKVGMTARSDVALRIQEIKNDLKKLTHCVSIELVGTFLHYGSLEKMVHAELDRNRFPLGKHREYFYAIPSSYQFTKLQLNDLGKRVLDNGVITVRYRGHARKVRAGQHRQQLINQTHIGRRAKTPEKLLQEHSDIVSAFKQALSLRNASTLTGKAVNTVRKVYDLLKSEPKWSNKNNLR